MLGFNYLVYTHHPTGNPKMGLRLSRPTLGEPSKTGLLEKENAKPQNKIRN